MSTVKTRNNQKTVSNISWGSSSLGAKSQESKDLVIFDSQVDNYQQLVNGVKAGFEVIAIDLFRDGIAQISEILGDRHNINNIHIISHGEAAALKLGSTELNIHNIETYSSQLQQWGKALNKAASILLYGCNIAASESGIKFIQKISEITGANIAASNNLTGSAALGGDWELEITTGKINTEIAFEKQVLEDYPSVLATLVTEEFKNDTVIGPWIYGISGTSANPGLTAGAVNPNGIIPNVGLGDTVGSGALRLTSNKQNQAAFVLYNNPISSTDGIRVTFDFFAYGAQASIAADGLSFFLIDGTATPTKAGGFGGSLGYAPNLNSASPGISGGYLGVGLDEYGFFSNRQSDPDPVTGQSNPNGRVRGPVAPGDFDGRLSDTVAVRGSESKTYNFLSSSLLSNNLTGVSIEIDNQTATSRTDANTKRSVQITLFPAAAEPNGRLAVAIDLNSNGTFDPGETLIDISNLIATNGAVPPTFKFGFAGSTGTDINTHELNNLLVESIDTPKLQADVSIAKQGPQVAALGSAITYTITSTNIGPSTSDAKDVLIQDILPPGLTGVTPSNNGTYNPTTRTVSWPVIPTLTSGGSVTYTVTAIAPATPTTITNVAYSNSSTFDPVVANNNTSLPTSRAITTITAIADLATTKDGTNSAPSGSTVSYTITTKNNGPNTADNVTITDSIIPGLTGVVVSDNGTYNSTTGIVTFPLATLTNQASTTRTISFIAPTGVSVSNTASSSSSALDLTPSNNAATVTTALTPSADVITTKTGTNSAAPGSTVSYTITTKNNGPNTADNVTITDSIIPGLTGVVVSDNGTYNSTTGIVTFPLVTLTNQASTTRSISFVAPAGVSVSNIASSKSSTPDPTPSNNDGTAPGAKVTTALTPSADVVTTKTGTNSAAPGATVSYTITTQNNGP
ncbi:DUF4347 domain-containing protein, partial [Microcoleus sp. CAWBG640]|uniref:DUF4347 domain-containing protein n=1 Tax=Microcoleus sp. CAWBG640 TaxID=2841653 RepID=UPI00312BC6C6